MNGKKVSKMMENRVFSQEDLLKMKKIMDRVKFLAEESYRKGNGGLFPEFGSSEKILHNFNG